VGRLEREEEGENWEDEIETKQRKGKKKGEKK
jgi:hypothetical protein